MSLHKNLMDRPPVETPRPSETVNTTYKHRLYPSLPNIHRYEFCLPVGSAREKCPPAPEFRPQSPLEDTESEVPPPSSDATMRAQIRILEEQKKELLLINEKWAKEYRTMVQYYKEKVQALKSAQFREEETREEEEKRVTLCKKIRFKTVKDKENAQTDDEGDAASDLLKAEREAKELRLQNSTLTRRGQHQHEEIKRLNKALEEMLQPVSASSETLHDVWKHQAEVYKEDFIRERRDREKLKDKYLELEKKLRKAHNELSVLKCQVTWTRQQQPSPLHCTCTHRAKGPNWEDGQVTQQHMLLQRRNTLSKKH